MQQSGSGSGKAVIPVLHKEEDEILELLFCPAQTAANLSHP